MNENTQERKSLSLETIWTTLYCANLFILFPLFLRDGYLDIMEAKTFFFLVTTIIYIIGTGAIYIIKKIQTGNNIFLSKNKIDMTDIWSIILLVIVLLNILLNKASAESLWAEEGKLFGSIFLILCIIGSFCISRTFQMNQGILWGAMIGSILTSIFVICSRFGIDLLNLYEIIVKNQRSAFLGTLGQINVVASFFCVFIPFWIGCYLYSKEIVSKLLFGITLFLSLTAGFCSNSDSIFLGIAGAYLFYLWFAFGNSERLSAYFQCVSLLFLSVSSVGVFTYLAEQGRNFTVKWDVLQQQFLKYVLVWLIIAIFLGICSVILKRLNLKNSLLKVRRVVFGIVLLLLVLGIAIIIINGKRLDGSNVIQKYITFDDSWGSNRGYVWKRTVQLFGKLPLWKKIVGCGMGMFPSFFKVFEADSMKQLGYYFVDAHNEFLQFLVTTGLIGCISYFGMIITTIIKSLLSIKSRSENKSESSENELSVIVPAILFVWLLQGLVNSPTVFITPYLFLFLGIGQDSFRQKEGEDEKRINKES